MVYMAVCENHGNRGDLLFPEKFDQIFGTKAGVNDHAILCRVAAAQDIAVGLILTQHQTVYFHFAAPANGSTGSPS
jgi:hypothetical protein